MVHPFAAQLDPRPLQAADWVLTQRHELLIGDRRVPPLSGRTFAVANLGREVVNAWEPSRGPEDIDRAADVILKVDYFCYYVYWVTKVERETIPITVSYTNPAFGAVLVRVNSRVRKSAEQTPHLTPFKPS